MVVTLSLSLKSSSINVWVSTRTDARMHAPPGTRVQDGGKLKSKIVPKETRKPVDK